MLFIVIGLTAAFNWLIIIKKIRMGRNLDATLDVGFMVTFTWLFGNTGQGGMMVAMVASAVVSVTLLMTPIDFGSDEDEDEEDIAIPEITIPTFTKL